jgi:hypothetical protein
LEEAVDYNKSEFSHTNDKLLVKISKVKDYQDFLNFYNNDDTYGLIKSTRTILKHAPLDFFVIGRYNQKHYVSKKLRDELIMGGFTGISFEEVHDIAFV